MNRKLSFFLARRTVLSSTHRLPSDFEPPYLRRRSNGFTLMELLIVMAIIAILMLIAIPTVGSLKKNANRLSAIQSIRAIQQAEMQYESTYPANGYACDLKVLGGDPGAGAASPTAAQILQPDIDSPNPRPACIHNARQSQQGRRSKRHLDNPMEIHVHSQQPRHSEYNPGHARGKEKETQPTEPKGGDAVHGPQRGIGIAKGQQRCR